MLKLKIMIKNSIKKEIQDGLDVLFNYYKQLEIRDESLKKLFCNIEMVCFYSTCGYRKYENFHIFVKFFF